MLEEIIWLLECEYCKRLIFLPFPGFMSHLHIQFFTWMKIWPNIIHKQYIKFFCTHSGLFYNSAVVFFINSEGLIYVNYSRRNPQTQQCFQLEVTIHLRSHCRSHQTTSDLNDWPSFASFRVFGEHSLRIRETVWIFQLLWFFF